MKIPAAVLKAAFKRLAPSSAPYVGFDTQIGSLTVADAEMLITTNIPALREPEGSAFTKAAVSHKLVSSVVSKLSGEADLSFDQSGLRITTAKASYDLPTTPFQPIGRPSPVSSKAVSLPELKAVLGYASTATNPKEALRYGSIRLQIGARLSAAGTDGRRLATAGIAETPIALEIQFPFNAVPAILQLEGDGVVVGDSQASVHVECGATTVVAQKWPHVFPDFSKVIPVRPTVRVELKAEEMREALSYMAPLVSDGVGEFVRLQLEADRIHVWMESAVGKSGIDVRSEFLIPDPFLDTPPPFRVAVNHGFMTEFFSSVSGAVQINGTDEFSPLWLTSGDKALLVTTNRI